MVKLKGRSDTFSLRLITVFAGRLVEQRERLPLVVATPCAITK